MRIEKDFIGSKKIEDKALYGIHSLRAKENFPDETRFHFEWYKSIGITKLACYNTYKSFKKSLKKKYDLKHLPLVIIEDTILDDLILAAQEVSEGKYFDNFIVPAVQGGAGTSINMNINEIITNASLIKYGKKPGDYEYIDPIEHANIFQSTNDIIPTSLKVTVIQLLVKLEESVNYLRSKVEFCENKYRNDLRIAYTQMQEAVPSSFGKLFSTYSDALSRDWWRVSKCFERIKTVNLGGSAVGTGITVPRYFIMEVVSELQKLTGLPVTKAENLQDATNNLDAFVEVHAILKAHAVNLEKISSDIRFLAADSGPKEINIPNKQVGSSIMPGKVNPVIPEFAITAAHKIYSNDVLITSLSAQGCLDLNAYIPEIGNAIIESLKLLIAVNKTLADNLFDGLTVNSEKAYKKLMNSPAITTALVPFIGYNKASEISKEMKTKEIDIFKANKKLKLIEELKLVEILKPENLLKTGYSMGDIIKKKYKEEVLRKSIEKKSKELDKQ
jgi:aspartate ammonia-lyase